MTTEPYDQQRAVHAEERRPVAVPATALLGVLILVVFLVVFML